MNIILFVAGIVIAFIISYFLFSNKQESSDEPHKTRKKRPTKQKNDTEYLYNKKKYFFTTNELYFYRDLQKATDHMNVVIFAKPRIADIIEPRKNNNQRVGFTKIRSKHIDFILCELPQVKPLLAIELDDSSHEKNDRKKRDVFVEHALQSADLPLLRVKSSQQLKEKIEAILQLDISAK